MEHAIEVPARWESLPRLIAFVSEVGQDLSLSDEQSYALRFVIEEIATNIIKYGYPDHDPGTIQIGCEEDSATLQITIRDHGAPFDPRDCPAPDLEADLMDRNIGGLGIFLVRDLADELTYTHDTTSGWNKLVVTIRT